MNAPNSYSFKIQCKNGQTSKKRQQAHNYSEGFNTSLLVINKIINQKTYNITEEIHISNKEFVS